MSKDRVGELQAKLDQAHARIAELEKYAKARPISVRQMKDEIASVIGQELNGGNYTYTSVVGRSDLVKIHAFIMGLKK